MHRRAHSDPASGSFMLLKEGDAVGAVLALQG